MVEPCTEDVSCSSLGEVHPGLSRTTNASFSSVGAVDPLDIRPPRESFPKFQLLEHSILDVGTKSGTWCDSWGYRSVPLRLADSGSEARGTRLGDLNYSFPGLLLPTGTGFLLQTFTSTTG